MGAVWAALKNRRRARRSYRRRPFWCWLRRGALAALSVLVVLAAVAAARSQLTAPAPSVLLHDRHGRFLAELPTADRGYGYWMVDELPPRVVAATLALEDQRFWSHPGVDPLAVGRAAWQNLTRNERISGASTIAMQVARMQRPAPRTYLNKTLEAWTAVFMTLRHGRQKVMAHYLRLVPYGNRIHGIAYAARRYLAKPVEDLSWAEIALLSAIPQSPSRMNPFDPAGRQRAVQRGQRILQILRDQAVISAEEYVLAQEQLPALRLPEREQRPEYALHAVLKLKDLLRAPDAGLAQMPRPLLSTTLDLKLQEEVSALSRAQLEQWRAQGAGNAAVIVLDKQGGEVRAWLGSNEYFDTRHGGAIDYTQIKRSPGSALKPFIYALAMEQGGLGARTIIDDLPLPGSGIRNADLRYLGPVLPRQALANSRNVPAARLVSELGAPASYDFLRRLGLHDDPRPAQHYGLGLALGALPVNLEQVVQAYTVLWQDGAYQPLRWFAHRPDPDPAPRRLLSHRTARHITLFLADPGARLPSFPRMGALEYPFPVAVKTGTSQGYRDAWTVAYSHQYLVGVWIGNADAKPMDELGGADSAAALAQALMLHLHQGQGQGLADLSFAPPEDHEPVRLCAMSGKQATEACPNSFVEWVPRQQIPVEVDDTFVRYEIDVRNGLPAHGQTPAPFRQVRTLVNLPARYAVWLANSEYKMPWAQAKLSRPAIGAHVTAQEVEVAIATPRDGARIIRNPEAPAAMNSVALSAVVNPLVKQIVWYVDGRPYEVVDYPYKTRLALTPGTHTIQARVPLTTERSPAIEIRVE